MEPAYCYKAMVTSVYDGDTVTMAIDLGMYTWLHDQKIRLEGINTPEIRGAEREAGLKSRDFLRGLILNKEVIVETVKDKKGKYGRWIGKVWIVIDKDWVCVNDLLVRKRLAKRVKY